MSFVEIAVQYKGMDSEIPHNDCISDFQSLNCKLPHCTSDRKCKDRIWPKKNWPGLPRPFLFFGHGVSYEPAFRSTLSATVEVNLRVHSPT